MTKLKGILLTQGMHGMISQVEGLAKALDLDFTHHTVELNNFWKLIPPKITPISQKVFKNIDLYRWGIYIRKPMKKLYTKNLTFLGDAAHPIVPFLGQGGCLALEDAEAFAYFLKEYQITKAQKYYNENRIYRVNRISSMSLNQGRLYHLSNKTFINARNRLMQFKFIRDMSTSFLWDYDFLNSKLNNFNS